MHLVVGTPCYGGLVHQRYMQSVCALMEFGNVNRMPVSVELLGHDSMITRARNTLVATFLDIPTATHLMFIDADIGFVPEHVDRMIKFDKDVVAGMYPLKLIHYDQPVYDRVISGEPLETAQLRYVGAAETGEALEETDGFVTGVFAGAGFMLLKRAALERLAQAYPETRYTAAHTLAKPQPSQNQYALFDGMIEPGTGHYLSEDYTFCHRWRAIGGKIWLDRQSRLIHIGAREFHGDASLRWSSSAQSASEA